MGYATEECIEDNKINIEKKRMKANKYTNQISGKVRGNERNI